MDIWSGYAKRKRSCAECTVGIVPGDRVFIGQYKRTGMYAGEKATRTTRIMTHFDCFVSKHTTYLDDNPYEPPTGLNENGEHSPGRPRKYTIEQGKRRQSLQMRMRRLVERQQYYNGQGMWAMADGYKEKVRVIREQLIEM